MALISQTNPQHKVREEKRIKSKPNGTSLTHRTWSQFFSQKRQKWVGNKILAATTHTWLTNYETPFSLYYSLVERQ